MLSASPSSMISSARRATPLTPPKGAPAQPVVSRPSSDFDAGINSSAAWTNHLERDGQSLSDEEPEDDVAPGDERGRPARALYAFEGKPEFRELSVEAGDELEILKEDLADGWSLVKSAGEVGLLPRTYYTFTSEFVHTPIAEPDAKRDSSESSSTTPRASTSASATTEAGALLPQNTGEWMRALPSFRRSLLGGKSLNRFSNFVTSGAEEWVLKGALVADDDAPPAHAHMRSDTNASYDPRASAVSAGGEADQHFVDSGPSWKPKVPPFRVLVHSPFKRTSPLSGAYIVYSVTSLFEQQEADEEEAPRHSPSDHTVDQASSSSRITVHRRFSHFVALHAALARRLPGVALPPLPEKQYAGRFSKDFVEARRGDLERYLSRLVRHPVVRYAEVLTFFLSCESDIEWKKLLPQHLALPAAGPSFYAHVFHPDFNLDAEDASEAVDRFETHTRAVGKGVQGVRNIFGRVREARVEMSKAERLLSYSLLSLITSKPLASVPTTGVTEDENETNKTKGLMNEAGAWCWREHCEDCLKLTKAMQRIADTLQSVADLYDDHARRTLLATHEALKGVAHPASIYAPVVETHRSTLTRYREGTSEGRTPDPDMASRCETVLNTTMAEMDTYHAQKVVDFSTLTQEHLDGEIAFYEQILARLYNARQTFDSPQYDELGESARQPSMYERELEAPRLTTQPLSQPAPHVFDSAPMRPVTVAIQDGVGMLFGGSGVGRSSVFGKFW